MSRIHETDRRLRPSRLRRGVVLVLVLVVVTLLSLAAATFTDWMLTEREAVGLYGQQIRAGAMAESGVAMARFFLVQDAQTRLDAGGVYDNPDQFQGVVVLDAERPDLRGRFTVLAPSLDDRGLFDGVRYGLENESARLNLGVLASADTELQNTGREVLMALPGMTEEIADAILDWIDEDDEPRQFGAEVDYYADLDPPYAPKNGPLDSIEELLLVRGVTPELLFGLDANRNGILDEQEQTQAFDAGVFDEDGEMDRGWSAYLTLSSAEKNVNSQGEARIYLGTKKMEKLYADLSAVMDPEWAAFIVAYKQFGPYDDGRTDKSGELNKSDKSGESISVDMLDLSRSGKKKLAQVLDLIGARVRIGATDGATTTVQSPFSDDPMEMGRYLPVLMDAVTVSKKKVIPGRININQAPRPVLLAIPGMTEEIADEIIARRQAEPDPTSPVFRSATWLLSEGIVTLDQMRALLPFVTAGGDVYRGQIVGYFDGGGGSARLEVVIDATKPLPRVLLWRDISRLGRGYSLETLGVEQTGP